MIVRVVRLRWTLIGLALSGLASHAASPPPKFDTTIDCSRWEHLNNYEMNQCSGRANAAADTALNAAYGKLMAKMGPGDRDLLVAAERAWLAWRDRECDFEAQGLGGYEKSGTGYSLEWSQCRLGLTKARITQLQGYLRDAPR
ncbi:MAG: lysozyme inhibitor LprI family protein [Burkholderiales bacterium]